MNNGFGQRVLFYLTLLMVNVLVNYLNLVECFASFRAENLKSQFVNWRVAVLTANVELLAMMKMVSFKRYKFKNGPLDCQLALYNLDEKQVSSSNVNAEFELKDSAFGNRLLKNKKNLKSWLKSKSKLNVTAYMMPIFLNIMLRLMFMVTTLLFKNTRRQKSLKKKRSRNDLQEVVYFAPKVLNVPTDKVIIKTRAKQKGKDQYQRVEQTKKSMVVNEHGAKFKSKPYGITLDTGLFLDHRKTRQIVAKKSKNKSLLNLFAYTGSVSLQAAVAWCKYRLLPLICRILI